MGQALKATEKLDCVADVKHSPLIWYKHIEEVVVVKGVFVLDFSDMDQLRLKHNPRSHIHLQHSDKCCSTFTLWLSNKDTATNTRLLGYRSIGVLKKTLRVNGIVDGTTHLFQQGRHLTGNTGSQF